MNKPKHRIVFDYINEQIATGRYGLGDQLPTDGQLMARFSVSRGTVGKAMRDLENAGLVLRRAGDGTYVRRPTTTGSAFLAVLIAGLGDTEFFEPICARIAQSCQKQNLSLIWGTLDEDDSSSAIDRFCRQLSERQVSGMFFAPDETPSQGLVDTNQLLLDRLSAAGIRVVLLDRSNRPFPECSEYDLVGIDNVHAGFMQTQHLLDCGCKRVLYIARPGFLPTKAARIAGYRLALKRRAIKIPDSWILEGDIDDPGFLKTILELKPDGIVCFHDPIAMTLVREFLKKRVRIPQRIKIVGVDDVRYSPYLPIPLTTIRQPCQEIADAAVTMMLQRLADPDLPPRDLRLATELIVRQSTVDA